MEVHPVAERVETADDVLTTATGIAKVKIMEQPELLATAIEHFLYKREFEIKDVILQYIEGHFRALLGTQKKKDIYEDKDASVELVLQVVAPDLGKLGVE